MRDITNRQGWKNTYFLGMRAQRVKIALRSDRKSGNPTRGRPDWMIEFRNVSKSFWTGEQRKVILDRASFRVELGNSLGILAPNGTGKTTIVNMMAGIEQPDEGEIVRQARISFPL